MDEKNLLLSEQFKNALVTAFDEELKNAKCDAEIKQIIDKFNNMDLQKAFSDILESAAKDNVDYKKSVMFQHVIAFRAEENEFLARLEQKWWRAFAASEAMYIMTLEAAKKYNNTVQALPLEEKEKQKWQYAAQLHIHGRAMQIFQEIISLMKGGFADGAYARWRSLFELSIVSYFIRSNGEAVARSFCESSNSDNRYEWAKASGLWSKKGKLTFNKIRNKCVVDPAIWNLEYNLANKIVHASPQGTFNRLGSMGSTHEIPVGRSDYGLNEAGECSAISLAQITANFFTVYTDEETIIAMKSIAHWIDIIREEYFKTHDLVFPEDEPLWKEKDDEPVEDI